jgi:hypothetical protein
MTTTSPVLNPELVSALKRLKLGRIAETLPERLVLADKQEMTFDDLPAARAHRRNHTP